MKLAINLIDVPKGRRPLVPRVLKEMTGSFDVRGQLQPIMVYKPEPDSKRYTLCFGGHRLAAAKALNWSEIDATEMTGDALDRRLAEIDENLIRAELTEMERAAQLKERKAIFDTKRAARPAGEQSDTTLVDGRKAGPQHEKGFDRDTADKTGLDKSTIRKSRKRAENIAPDVQASIKGTPAADSGVELDALAKATPKQQRKAVKKVKAGKAKTVRAALKPKAKQAKAPEAALVKVWKAATPAARKAFIAHVRTTAPKLFEATPAPKAATVTKPAPKPAAKKPAVTAKS